MSTFVSTNQESNLPSDLCSQHVRTQHQSYAFSKLSAELCAVDMCSVSHTHFQAVGSSVKIRRHYLTFCYANYDLANFEPDGCP